MNHQLYLTWIGIGWVIFWVYWLASAAASKKNLNRNRHLTHFIWIRVAIFAAAIVVIRLTGRHNGSLNYSALAVNNNAIQAIGAALFGLGLALAIWARVNLGRNWGMPMSHKAEPQLVTSGPYKYVRHPIYTGMLAALLGTALVVSLYWLIIVLAAGLYFVFSASQEEKYLQTVFPKDYPEYMHHTKMLLPFVF